MRCLRYSWWREWVWIWV